MIYDLTKATRTATSISSPSMVYEDSKLVLRSSDTILGGCAVIFPSAFRKSFFKLVISGSGKSGKFSKPSAHVISLVSKSTKITSGGGEILLTAKKDAGKPIINGVGANNS